MTMLTMFNNYLEYLVLYNAPGYVSYEKQQFKFFEMYYDGFASMDSSFFTKDKILALMSDLKKKGLSFNTINKHVSFLKRIYKFNNVECPFQSIKKLHEKFVTFGTTKEDPLDVFKQLEGVVSLQSLTILYLFYDTGIRLNELLNIEVRNVFLEKRCIFLTTTKTNKDRYVYFSNHTKKLVAKHLNLSGNKGYLFTNKDGGKLKESAIESLFARIRRKLKITNFSPHRLRHSLSSEMYNNGCDLILISDILGHSNLNTTRRYIHPNINKNLEKYDNFHKKR